MLKILITSLALLAGAGKPSVAAETGVASWYGSSHQGNLTASGERFDMNKPTCAHKTLPLGSIVMITRVDNGAQAICRVNDRGPYVKHRTIDLAKSVAETLHVGKDGVMKIRLTVLWKAHAQSSH